jgi:hypothetical protein
LVRQLNGLCLAILPISNDPNSQSASDDDSTDIYGSTLDTPAVLDNVALDGIA